MTICIEDKNNLIPHALKGFYKNLLKKQTKGWLHKIPKILHKKTLANPR